MIIEICDKLDIHINQWIYIKVDGEWIRNYPKERWVVNADKQCRPMDMLYLLAYKRQTHPESLEWICSNIYDFDILREALAKSTGKKASESQVMYCVNVANTQEMINAIIANKNTKSALKLALLNGEPIGPINDFIIKHGSVSDKMFLLLCHALPKDTAKELRNIIGKQPISTILDKFDVESYDSSPEDITLVLSPGLTEGGWDDY